MGTKRYCGMMALLLAGMDGAGAQSPVPVRTQPFMQPPKPGALETYRDWTIGCDNGGRCEAVSLMPQDYAGDDPLSTIAVARGAGPQADAEIWAQFEGKGRLEVVFSVDGRKVASATATDGEARLTGPAAAALAVAMAKGARMAMQVGTKRVGAPSLSGSAAALRYMDAQQGRAGTVTALIATGPLASTAVRNAPMTPIVRRVGAPARAAPVGLWREELTSVGKLTGCTDEMKDARPPEQYRLSETETLVLVPCGSGAYNFTSVPVIATGTAGRRTFRFATFDYQPGWSEDPKHPMLVNAGWTAATSRLDSYAKGRGLGDCGGSEAYVWDGARFRLIEATAMGECRGAARWIRTWTAQVVE